MWRRSRARVLRSLPAGRRLDRGHDVIAHRASLSGSVGRQQSRTSHTSFEPMQQDYQLDITRTQIDHRRPSDYEMAPTLSQTVEVATT